MEHQVYGIYEGYIKRILDIACVIFTLLLFWWMLVIIAIIVRVKLGSPVMFTQNRVGKNERVFKLYKFRTMTNDRDENGKLLPDDVRLTKFGKLLRSSSLDELPELFNILKGEMSIVGPRPLLTRYLPYYMPEERHRHDVRPGLTGPAQIHGRNFLVWDERFAYDIEYVKEITFLNDCKILFHTIRKVFKREGIIVHWTEETLPDFDVYRKEQLKRHGSNG